MAEKMERVTDPVPETTKSERAKDSNKLAAGRAGDAARKAKMLEALRAAKESLCSSAVPLPHPHPSPAGESSIPLKEAESKDQEHADKRLDVPVALQTPENNREGRTYWTTWIIGACLADALFIL